MTTWIEESTGGRARGPRGVARAWLEVVWDPGGSSGPASPRGDQAPGLVFAVVVAVAFAGLRLVSEPPLRSPVFAGSLVSSLIALAAVALLVAPAAFHLTAAVLTTILLVATVRVRATIAALRGGGGVRSLDRAGVSETVQLVAYAGTPGVFAALPAVALFGYGFGGVAAAETLLGLPA